MFSKKKKFYITTSIAYTNAQPHIGFALESIQADALARYYRTLGQDVFFLTGTDEHGAKVSKKADESKKDPKDFVDEIAEKFKELKSALNLSTDDFIRTTDEIRHWPIVEKVWESLKENGDIHKKNYKGLYCVGCEAFITRKDLTDGKCSVHSIEPEVIEEENYFFKLSKYSKRIEDIIKQNKIKIVPESRKNEMLSFTKQGLQDVSFSRPRKDLKWGIQVPGDPTQTIYVWADALTNYISAIDYPNGKQFKKYWPADVHCIGKDIAKFHCLFWSAMLLSLKLPLPKTIFIHGHITVAGQKMSKSSGNVIDPFELVKKYGVDAVRYYLLREIPPTEDGDFSYEKFEQRYNSDLAGGIGNLVARIIGIAGETKIKVTKVTDVTKEKIEQAKKDYKKNIENFKFNEALSAIWFLIGYCDKYINDEKLWETKKPEAINDLFLSLNEISDLLLPFLPDTSEKIKKAVKTRKSKILFPRI